MAYANRLNTHVDLKGCPYEKIGVGNLFIYLTDK